MLRIVNLEEIQDMLLHIPTLVDLQEQRDPNFVIDTKKWLAELEKVLTNNRLTSAGIVAALRGELISAERGVIPAGIELKGRVTRRKIREATAAHLIRQTSELVTNIIQRDQERFAEGERLIRQLVSIAKAKGLIQELLTNDSSTEALRSIWKALLTDPDLSAGVVNVEGLVGPYDSLIILKRIVNY